MMTIKKRALLGLLITFSGYTMADNRQDSEAIAHGNKGQTVAHWLTLAKLGNATAQVALAEAYGQGLGTEVNFTLAYAWSLMAMDSKHPGGKPLYLRYRRLLASPKQGKARYKALRQNHGIDALKQQLYPHTGQLRQPLTPAAVPLHTPAPQPPPSAGWAIVAYDISDSGSSANIRILAADPHDPQQATEQTLTATVQRWQFKPPADDSPGGYATRLHLFEFGPRSGADSNVFDPKKNLALQQIHEKAAADSAAHQYWYAKLLEFGLVGDTARAPLEWLLRAAVNGHGRAQYEIFACLSAGTHCRADHDKRLKWLTIASEQGQVDAAYVLAKAYLERDNQWLQYNPQAALEWLEKLIRSNHLPALIRYARLLADSDDNGIKDLEKAIKYAQQGMALDHNNPDLLAVLGIAYFELGQVKEGQQFLMQAIREAELRHRAIDNYVNTLEDYQRAALRPRKDAKQIY